MITNWHIQQKRRTVFTIGSNDPSASVVFIQGSCRSIAYLNYLNIYNNLSGGKLRIHFADPGHLHWNEDGTPANFEVEMKKSELNEPLLQAIKSTSIFIHEHYENFGMFNSKPESASNIYQFGMNPEKKICVPNFHDFWIMISELILYYPELRKMADEDRFELSDSTVESMRSTGLSMLERFYKNCRRSSIPEMEQWFAATWAKRRLFWTGNHVTNEFSLYIFRAINEKFLSFELDNHFWLEADKVPSMSTPVCPVTKFDVKAFGIEWPEEVKPLKVGFM